jgi:hypothetical protein
LTLGDSGGVVMWAFATLKSTSLKSHAAISSSKWPAQLSTFQLLSIQRVGLMIPTVHHGSMSSLQCVFWAGFKGRQSKGTTLWVLIVTTSTCLLIIMHVHDSLSMSQFLLPKNMGHLSPQLWKLYQWIFALLVQVCHWWMMWVLHFWLNIFGSYLMQSTPSQANDDFPSQDDIIISFLPLWGSFNYINPMDWVTLLKEIETWLVTKVDNRSQL